MADIITVQIKLDARQATRQLQNFQKQAAGITTSQTNAQKQIQRTNKSVNRSINLLRLYASAWIAAAAAASTIREIAAVQNMERAISTVTNSAQELEDTFNNLQASSLRTRSDFEANVTLYQRLRFATEDLGVSSEELLRVTESVAAGLRLGGATGQEAASSIRQISQAFSKGKLDGDEFRSVMENAGFLMNEFRKEMGFTREELLEMSRQGRLTSDVLVEGFGRINETVVKTLENLPRTIDDAISTTDTAWKGLIETLSDVGAFDIVVQAIDAVAEAFKGLENATIFTRFVFSKLGIAEPLTIQQAEENVNKLTAAYEKAREVAERPVQRGKLEQFIVDVTGFGEETTAQKNAREALEKLNEARAVLNKMEAKAKAEAVVQEGKEEAKRLRMLQASKDKERKIAQERLEFLQDVEKYAEGSSFDYIEDYEKEQEKIRNQIEKDRQEFQRFLQEPAEGIVGDIFGEFEDKVEPNALQSYAESVMKLEDVFVNSVKGMEDALVEFVMTGKLDFSSMVDSMIADITRLVIQQQITGPIAQGLGGLFTPNTPGNSGTANTTSGLGGLITSGFNWVKGLGLFQHGGSFTVGGRSGIDKNLVAFRASKGEQVTVTPRGQAGGINIVMNVTTNDAESFGRNQDQIMNTLQSRLSMAQRNM